MALALCTSSDDILSMYKVLFNSLLYFQKYASDKLNIAKIRKSTNFVNTGDRVLVLAFCDSLPGLLSVFEVSFNPFVYFQRYVLDKLFIAKIKKGRNSVKTVDGVMIFAFCTSSDGHLLIVLVSFNSLVYFHIYAPDKLFIAKIKGSNSVKTVDRVTILASYTSADSPLSMYQVSFNSHAHFQRHARVMVLAFCTSSDGPL